MVLYDIGPWRPLRDIESRHSLRLWWHGLLREYGRYNCYGLFFLLPSDEAVVRYLKDYRNELDLVSGDSCLIIELTESGFRRSDFDIKEKRTAIEYFMSKSRKTLPQIYGEDSRRSMILSILTIFLADDIDETAKEDLLEFLLFSDVTDKLVKGQVTPFEEHISEGYSIQISRLFDIALTEFPCLVLFEDIRSPKHVLFTLKDMTTNEISVRMRWLFSIINKAVSDKQPVLETLQAHQDNQMLLKAGKSILKGIRSAAGKTFEAAMEVLIESTLKP
jgi:hypothetical protein